EHDPSLPGKPTDFILRFEATAYDVQAVRLTVDSSHTVDVWEEIDAVCLLTGGSPSGLTLSTSALNRPPEAADDWTTTEVNQDVTVSVLGNDFDPDGDALTIDSADDGAHGTVSVGVGGLTVTYTPDEDYTGTDSFTVTVSDGCGGTAEATVHVKV